MIVIFAGGASSKDELLIKAEIPKLSKVKIHGKIFHPVRERKLKNGAIFWRVLMFMLYEMKIRHDFVETAATEYKIVASNISIYISVSHLNGDNEKSL